MSDQVAGFGPAWLPPGVRQTVAAAEQREAREAREAQRDAEVMAESRRSQAVEAFRSAAEARGEHVDVQAMISGAGLGRTVADVLAEAAAVGERADAAAEHRRQRAEGGFEILPYQRAPRAMALGELPDRTPATRSAQALEVENRNRHFTDRLEARRRADAFDGIGPVYA